MKKLILSLVCLASLSASAQVKQNRLTTTNDVGVSALISPGVVYVDGISGHDTNSGAITQPVATLAKANELSTSGTTVYVKRGTFAEAVWVKQGVKWVAADGVLFAGLPTFTVSSSNAVTSFKVEGHGAFTNYVVAVHNLTNCVISISGKSATPGGSAPLVYDWSLGLGRSNRVWLEFDDIVGTTAVATTFGGAELENWFYVSARRSAVIRTTAGSGSGSTNFFFKLSAPRLTSSGGFFAATTNNVVVESEEFSRGSFGLLTVSPSYFWQVSVLTTNDLNTNLANIKGSVNVWR